nr:Dna2/Cas4 domain-containing protein [uncultured Emticicia sp.]
MPNYLFSKTAYIKGVQCDKQLYLYKHHYKLQDPLSPETMAKFRGGHDFEDAYRAAKFPFAVDIEKIAKNRNEYQTLTQKVLQKQVADIFEATFVYQDVLVMNDVLTRSGGKWEIQEIKNSSELKPTHIQDIALQYFVTKGALGKELDAKIVLNDGANAYTIIDVTAEVKVLQDNIAANIQRFKNILDQDSVPPINIGSQCEVPYKCSFFGYCHKA